MNTHFRVIDKLLTEIDRESALQRRREKIQWLFKSEWRPEYIAGAIALGKYARLDKDQALEDFMLNIINGYGSQKKGNIHEYRHALIALPAYLGTDHPGVRKILDWAGFCDAMKEANNETKTLGEVCKKFPDLFSEWIQQRREQNQKEKQNAESYLERFKNDSSKQKAIKSKNKIIEECEQLEKICAQFDRDQLQADYLKAFLPGDKSTPHLPQYRDLRVPINPYNPKNGNQISVPIDDIWSRVSLVAGFSEGFAQIEQALAYAQVFLDHGRQKSDEIEMALNVPFFVSRVCLDYYKQISQYRQQVERIILDCEKVFPFLKASSFDAVNFLMDLSELKCAISGAAHKTEDLWQVIQQSAGSLSGYLQEVPELDEKVHNLQSAAEKGEQNAFVEKYRQILYQLKDVMEDRNTWNLQTNQAQKACMVLAGWHFLYVPFAVDGKRGLLRIERRVHLAAETLKETQSAKDDELVQFFIRLVKELYYHFNKGSLKQGEKQESEKHYILTQFVVLLDMLNAWGWDFMIPKDLGTIMGNLLERSWLQEQDTSLALWLAVMGEYAHIDLDVYRIGRDFVRVPEVKTYLDHMIAAEKDILGTDRGKSRGEFYAKYKQALICVDPEQESIYAKLLDFMALRDRVGGKKDEWQAKYAEGLGAWRGYLKRYLFINVDKTFYERNGFELLLKTRDKRTAIEQEYQEFQHAKETALDQQIAYLERLMIDISRLVGTIRNHDIQQVRERQEALRELQNVLAEYKTWINQHLPYTMKYVVLSRVNQLIQDVENHREVNGMLVNALNQRNEEQLDELTDTISRKWGINYSGASYACIYKDMIFQAQNQIICSRNDGDAEDMVIAQYENLIAADEESPAENAGQCREENQNPEGGVSRDVAEGVMKENEQWMYGRFMFKDLAETYMKTAKKHSMQFKALGWNLYKWLLSLPAVMVIILFPYVFYAGIAAINHHTPTELPSWAAGAGFVFYLAIDGLLIVLLVAGAGWFIIKNLLAGLRQNRNKTEQETKPERNRYLKNKLYSPINMFVPKVLGLMFVALGGIIAATEGWEISIHARTPTIILSICLFASIIYIFIRQELLKNYPISSPRKSQRASNLFSLIIIESYFIVIFFSTVWGVLYKTIADYEPGQIAGPEYQLFFFPPRISLDLPEIIPFQYVYPGAVLMWTFQIAFIGVVLHLFLTRDRLVDVTE